MKLLLLSELIAISLCSCEVNHYKAVAKNGNSIQDDSYVLGSTYSNRRSDGSSRVYDGQDSFRSGTGAVTTLGVGVIGHLNTASNNTLSAVKVSANTKGTVLTQKLPDGSTVQTITYPPQQ